MNGSRKQIILIGGGDSYSNHEDFLEALKVQQMWDLPTDTPHRSWKSWLVEELGEGWCVDMPKMPNKENAKYEEWKIWFERHLAEIKEEVILVGLSLGAMFLAKYLIENDVEQTVSKLILLAGPCGYYEDDTGNDCGSFAFDASKLKSVQAKAGNIIIMHSKDDFVVPYEHGEQYAAALPEAEFITFEDKNHFLIEEFPELLEKIKVM